MPQFLFRNPVSKVLWRHLGVVFSHYNLRDDSGVLFDLEADQVSIAADLKVVVLDVAEPVGKVQHGAIRKLDVELLHVEVDAALKGDTSQ